MPREKRRNWIWVVEMYLERKWHPTVGVALDQQAAFRERRLWKARNPHDRFRVVQYISVRTQGY